MKGDHIGMGYERPIITDGGRGVLVRQVVCCGC